jgi:hypothetical protein
MCFLVRNVISCLKQRTNIVEERIAQHVTGTSWRCDLTGYLTILLSTTALSLRETQLWDRQNVETNYGEIGIYTALKWRPLP